MALFDLIDQKITVSSNVSPTTLTFTATVPDGSLVVAWARNNSDNTRSVTDSKGNTYTKLPNGDYFWGDIYYCCNVVGDASLAVSFNNGGASVAAFAIMAFVGTSTVALDAYTTIFYNGGGTSAWDTGSLTTTESGDLLICCLGAHSAALHFGVTDGSGFSQIQVDNSGDYLSSERQSMKIASGAGSYSSTGNAGSGGDILGQLVAFKPGAGVTPTPFSSFAGVEQFNRKQEVVGW